MKAINIVREIMQQQGIGTNRMADKLGKPARLVSDRLRQDNISVDKLNEMLRLLDYKIVIVPRDTRLPENCFKVD